MVDVAAIQEPMNRFGQALFGTAATNLTLMLNQEATLDGLDLNGVAALEDVMGGSQEPFGAGSPKLGVVVSINTGTSTVDGVFWLKNTDAGYLANTMLGQADAQDSDVLDELQTSAVGEIFSQLLTAAHPSMAAVLGAGSVTSAVANVIAYTQEDVRSSAPHLLALPFVQVQANFQLSDGRGVPFLLWLSEEDVTALMSAVQLADTTPSASPAGGADAPISLTDDDIAAALASMDAAAPDMAMTTPPPSTHIGNTAASQASVKVQPVQFASFDNQPDMMGENNRNLELVLDVTLNLTVRLGEADLPLKQVLELTRGSVVELNRVAGEPVDLYANGKLIAKGEVVVIEDNFGLRITNIVSPAERLRELAAAAY
ncbi:MAG: flagellar motor switch protein FliN [Vampirovibrionales bacterium]